MGGPGCLCCGCRSEVLNLNGLCVLCQVEIERDLRRERAEQLHALRAFGEAIATIARARLIDRVTAGGMVSVEFGDGRAFELWSRGETLYVSGWGHDGEVELRRFHGDPEDNAAAAVAALIEECER